MNHLAIDTATEVLSVALRVDGALSRAFHEVRDEGLRHARLLMPIVDDLLRQAALGPDQLDLVSCMRGPGSFTGLRIGMATAKGLASAIAALDALPRPPVVSVATLDVMAAASGPAGVIVALIDARKGRYYAAVYRDGRRLSADLDVDPAGLLLHLGRILPGIDTKEVLLCGPHVSGFMNNVECRELPDGVRFVAGPDYRGGYAPVLLDLAERRLQATGYDPVDQGPVYVRRSDAELSRET